MPKSPLELHQEFYERRRREIDLRRVPKERDLFERPGLPPPNGRRRPQPEKQEKNGRP